MYVDHKYPRLHLNRENPEPSASNGLKSTCGTSMKAQPIPSRSSFQRFGSPVSLPLTITKRRQNKNREILTI